MEISFKSRWELFCEKLYEYRYAVIYLTIIFIGLLFFSGSAYAADNATDTLIDAVKSLSNIILSLAFPVYLLVALFCFFMKILCKDPRKQQEWQDHLIKVTISFAVIMSLGMIVKWASENLFQDTQIDSSTWDNFGSKIGN